MQHQIGFFMVFPVRALHREALAFDRLEFGGRVVALRAGHRHMALLNQPAHTRRVPKP